MRLLRNAVLLATLAAASTLAAVRLRPSSRGSAADVPAAVAQRAQAGGAGRQRRWFQIAALLTVLAAGGLLVAASGIVPLKASSGHWSITAWFLHFAMRRSVATHTLGLQAPRSMHRGSCCKAPAITRPAAAPATAVRTSHTPGSRST